ncbi:glycosyltransferase family protein [Cyclobacterium xiamenense]|uniref:hypothetical protein n=1 Tax=Cyclobacterium xiamenense TaxID=1297121 RepID=UPI0012B7A1E6|nr:hypothetical protein [Cyclobacterium xiamenense]
MSLFYFYSIIKKKILNYFFYHLLNKKYDLIIFDNILPLSFSPWRNFEFEWLVKSIDNSKIVCSLTGFKKFSNEATISHSRNELVEGYPSLHKKLHVKRLFNGYNTKLFYCLFYDNLLANLSFLRKSKTPFIFTLYPGGGFLFNNPIVDKNLHEIFSLSNFKGVIVNQYATRNYIESNFTIKKESIFLIPGVPFNDTVYLDKVNFLKEFSGKLKILFMAQKNMAGGKDKGFDFFINISKILIRKGYDICFEIIGNFDESDLDSQTDQSYYFFHGRLNEDQFPAVLNETHMIISPNKPFVLKPGSFDGFPLGTCVIAGYFINGLFLTDFLEESHSTGWIDGYNFCKLDGDLDNSCNKIILYINNREKLKKIALNGREKVKNDYSFRNQITPRIELFKTILLS